MAVTWNWKEKMGEVLLKQKDHQNKKWISFKLNIYKGNCLAVIIHDFKKEGKDMYNFYAYFGDFTHLKKCLGLTATTEYDYATKKPVSRKSNILCTECSKWAKVKLNSFYPENLRMADYLAKAGIKTEIYYKNQKED